MYKLNSNKRQIFESSFLLYWSLFLLGLLGRGSLCSERSLATPATSASSGSVASAGSIVAVAPDASDSSLVVLELVLSLFVLPEMHKQVTSR